MHLHYSSPTTYRIFRTHIISLCFRVLHGRFVYILLQYLGITLICCSQPKVIRLIQSTPAELAEYCLDFSFKWGFGLSTNWIVPPVTLNSTHHVQSLACCRILIDSAWGDANCFLMWKTWPIQQNERFVIKSYTFDGAYVFFLPWLHKIWWNIRWSIIHAVGFCLCMEPNSDETAGMQSAYEQI